nr:MAG TPA: hypothetical protein [Caudoviricetes sp.]
MFPQCSQNAKNHLTSKHKKSPEPRFWAGFQWSY